ncbi:MAG: hypothetical protein AAEJ47_03370 [Planctomycetota bacterium]|nr:hypothetical protein [Planctomycetota bacterium]
MDQELLKHCPAERSLMVISRREEHCILYDGTDLPSLLEQLLLMGSQAPETLEQAAHRDDEVLSQDHFRAVIRELLSRIHSQLL